MVISAFLLFPYVPNPVLIGPPPVDMLFFFSEYAVYAHAEIYMHRLKVYLHVKAYKDFIYRVVKPL